MYQYDTSIVIAVVVAIGIDVVTDNLNYVYICIV